MTTSIVKEDLGVSTHGRLQDQFERIAEAEWHILYRAVLRAGLDGQTAEGVVPEALCRACCLLVRMPEKERDKLKVRAWLAKITAEVVERALHA